MKKMIFLFIIFSFCHLYAGDTTFYDAQWKTSSPQNATYYRVLNKKNDLWKVEDYFINHQLQMSGYFSSLFPEIKEGEFKFFNRNGILTETGNYINGKKDGKYIFFYDNGNVEIEETWQNGVKNGQVKAFQEDGTKLLEGYYLNGLRNGQWKYFDFFGKHSSSKYFQKLINISPAGLSFEFPNDEWYASDNSKKDEKIKYNFQRMTLDSKDDSSSAILTVIIEKLENNETLLANAIKRFQALNIKTEKDVSNILNIDNALAYQIEFRSNSNFLINGYLVFIKTNDILTQIYLETSHDSFELSKNEFIRIIKSIKNSN